MKNLLNIVESLRKEKIEPSSSAKNDQTSSYPSSNALQYNEATRFNSNNEEDQYWSVDFTKKVSIFSYQIKAIAQCNWISNWTLSMSNDNEKWIIVDSQEKGYPEDKLFVLKRNVNT